MKKISVIIVGAGGRGTIYSEHIKKLSDKAEIVAVAEPKDFFRERIVKAHNIKPENVFKDWRDILKREKFADAVIISTQDRMHREPAIAFAEKKYHIMIEKPLAPTLDECKQIVRAVKENNVMMSVCHVLRYSNYTRTIKSLLDSGRLGKIMTIQHLEPVGHWRFAHSYVRGNWRKESESSSILLAKSIHDLDWICYIAGDRCKKVSSFGSLMFFRKENKPAGSADRCLECANEKNCAYSAPRFYIDRVKSGKIGSYVESVVGAPTEENIMDQLWTSQYGRCVFSCDNDVADHQVVNVEFEHGATAVFTLAGCSKYGNRRTTVFGSEGELFGDGEKITLHSYLTGQTEEIKIPPPKVNDHHEGADFNLLESFVDAIITGDQSKIVSGAEESMSTHGLVFAAEFSRHRGKVVNVECFEAAMAAD